MSINIKSKNRYFKGIRTNVRTVSEMVIYDIDLVKHDLLLHLHTPKGSRVMFPKFGTTIYEKLFEPFSQSILNQIKEEVEFVFSQEPRVKVLNLDVGILNNNTGIFVEVNCEFLPFKTIDTIYTEFINNSRILQIEEQ
ncbi:MAG: GPW/gp25 family protein [Candidatus Dojkabacteria bacterium]|nr:GPW/gp25 family protein [Candidatus Dojkabacteria bacterium]